MIYDNIVALCEKKNMSIRALESKAGLGNGTIGKWKNQEPKIYNITAVAKVLRVSVNTLLKEKKDDTN